MKYFLKTQNLSRKMFSSVIGLLGEFFKVRKKNHIAAGTCINNGNINVAKTVKNDL